MASQSASFQASCRYPMRDPVAIVVYDQPDSSWVGLTKIVSTGPKERVRVRVLGVVWGLAPSAAASRTP